MNKEGIDYLKTQQDRALAILMDPNSKLYVEDFEKVNKASKDLMKHRSNQGRKTARVQVFNELFYTALKSGTFSLADVNYYYLCMEHDNYEEMARIIALAIKAI